MPTFNWQSAAAIAIVAWAVVHIGRTVVRVLRTKRKSTSCGGCGTCSADGAAKSPAANGFVPLENLRRTP